MACRIRVPLQLNKVLSGKRCVNIILSVEGRIGCREAEEVRWKGHYKGTVKRIIAHTLCLVHASIDPATDTIQCITYA